VVIDPTGKQWLTMDFFGVSALISLFVMAPWAFLAWLRLEEKDS
jgi:hypothetical protein